MITNPTRQRTLRGHMPTQPVPRAINSVEHQAALAWRLTPRDKWVARMLWEHQVLTAHQITDMAFAAFRTGRSRLRELYLWGVVDRFQPFLSIGTSPMHYVLAPAGAAMLAAEDGIEVKAMGYRRDRSVGIAHSLRLAHTVGVNEFFAALVDHAHHPYRGEHGELAAWWSEARCARHFGDIIRPDGYGRWHHTSAHQSSPQRGQQRGQQGERQVEWFLEFDFGTENLAKLAGKLTGYAKLAATTGITTPVLVWLPTARREAAARHALARVWRELDHRRMVPVATAAAELLDPDASHPSPADQVWLPLDTAFTTATAAPAVDHAGGARRALVGLLDAWPHIPAPTIDDATGGPSLPHPARRPLLPPPSPMPPVTHRTRAQHTPAQHSPVQPGPAASGSGTSGLGVPGAGRAGRR